MASVKLCFSCAFVTVIPQKRVEAVSSDQSCLKLTQFRALPQIL